MTNRICIIGLDPAEYHEIRERVNVPILAHEMLPRIMVHDGQLFVEATNSMAMRPVSHVIYHGIFEDDFEFITGLALWGGPCLPNPHAMMDCRHKFACLVRALKFTRYGSPLRGYISPQATYQAQDDRVAKWGNWHCGENKHLFTSEWTAEHPSIVEPFIEGEAVRIAVVGNHHWQIRLVGEDWLKSIHAPDAELIPIDSDLLEDALAIGAGFGLELFGIDYMVTADDGKHLLEVNHIPNVTRFPAIWEAYRDFVVEWISRMEVINHDRDIIR
jgi:glutathione synthase/RimK-type ligase-like ATP-grasp enzyme